MGGAQVELVAVDVDVALTRETAATSARSAVRGAIPERVRGGRSRRLGWQGNRRNE